MLSLIIFLGGLNAYPIDPVQKQRDLNLNYGEMLESEINYIGDDTIPKGNALVDDDIPNESTDQKNLVSAYNSDFIDSSDCNDPADSVDTIDLTVTKDPESIQSLAEDLASINTSATMSAAETESFKQYSNNLISNSIKSATSLIFFVVGILAQLI
jgi:hypothetical protein